MTERSSARRKRKFVSSVKRTTGKFILINGNANYFFPSKAKRSRLIKRLRDEGKLKEDFRIVDPT